jgi:hypothetical protein
MAKPSTLLTESFLLIFLEITFIPYLGCFLVQFYAGNLALPILCDSVFSGAGSQFFFTRNDFSLATADDFGKICSSC